MGSGSSLLSCLGGCGEEIPWQQLARALTPLLLSRLLQHRQQTEVQAADMEGLVTCPFCPYAAIMEQEEDRVLVCRNPECGRESCRLCRRSNHVPFTWAQVVERGEHSRREMEERMTQAMIRECGQCHQRFFKEEGCNKVTCPHCHSHTCYICGARVQGYGHFYNRGGGATEQRTCPCTATPGPCTGGRWLRLPGRLRRGLGRRGLTWRPQTLLLRPKISRISSGASLNLATFGASTFNNI